MSTSTNHSNGATGGKPAAEAEAALANLRLTDEPALSSTSTPSKRFGLNAYNVRHGPFVQRGAESREEDPFISPYKPPQARLGSQSPEGSPAKAKFDPLQQANWRDKSRTNSGDSASPTDYKSTSRAIDIPAGISSDNAQAKLPPSACVFVANLSSMESELELQASVTEAFSEYGAVWVKIRRDNKNMPYAFCQYTCDEHAIRAVLEGKNRLLHNRPCRTERAKAHRTYYMSKSDGTPLTLEEGTAVLENVGVAISHAWYPDEGAKSLHSLDGGIFVQMKYYDAGRAAQQAMRNEGIYQLEMTQNIFESPVSAPAARSPMSTQAAAEFLERYEHDRKSIFVSNMPPTFTEQDFKALFEPFGTIVSCVLFQRPSDRDDQPYLFGHIEFEDLVSAQRAIDAKHRASINGSVLKVAFKDTNRKHRGAVKNGQPARVSPLKTPKARNEAELTIQTGNQRTANASYPGSPYGWMGYPSPYATAYPGYWGSPPYMSAPLPNAYGGSPPSVATPYWNGYNYNADTYAQYAQYCGMQYYHTPATTVQSPTTEESPVINEAAQHQNVTNGGDCAKEAQQ